MTRGLLLGALLALTGSVSGAQVPPDLPGSDDQQSPAISSDQDPAPSRSPSLVAAAWCPVYTGARDPDAPGCDIGVGVSLYSLHRLAWVAAIGTETVGTGLAWIASKGGHGRLTIAVSVGVVARYDEGGIDGGQLAPAVGATFGFGRGD